MMVMRKRTNKTFKNVKAPTCFNVSELLHLSEYKLFNHVYNSIVNLCEGDNYGNVQ